MENNIIPIFFAVNDNYSPYLGVALKSMLENASKKYEYKIYVMETSLSDAHKDQHRQIVSAYPNASIKFVNVAERLDGMGSYLHMRDYYSKETYYRFFIAPMFPQYDKVLYLDCDIAVVGDISEMYNIELGNNLLGSAIEEVVFLDPIFRAYSEKCLGVLADDYLGAGILVINTKLFREEHVEEQFVSLLKKYKFYVAQDQDYLNVICKNRISYLDLGWNKTAFKNPDFNDANLKIVHYKMSWKPWLNDGVEYEMYFWKYAQGLPVYDEIMAVKRAYTDEQRQKDAEGKKKLLEVAVRDTEDENNYWNQQLKGRVAKKFSGSWKPAEIKLDKNVEAMNAKKTTQRTVYGNRNK